MLKLAHDKDGNLARSARMVLENLTEEDARQALCQQVIDPGDSIAQAIATELGLLPKPNSQKALFLLLTEQWEAYHTLDFDQRLPPSLLPGCLRNPTQTDPGCHSKRRADTAPQRHRR